MQTLRRAGTLLLAAVGLLSLLPTTAAAEVSVSRGTDGTLVIRGSGPPADIGSSAPVRLRPIPEASWSTTVDEHCRRHEVDPRLVQAVMQIESAYDPAAVSHKGAVGLMQLMPQTARSMRVADPFEPLENIRGGIEYLKAMLDRFGDRVELALAAYNAGPRSVERYEGIPPYRETRSYVDKVLRLYNGEETTWLDDSRRDARWRDRASPPRRGRGVRVRRDAEDRIVITTTGS